MAYRRRQGITRSSTFKEEIHYPLHQDDDLHNNSNSSSYSSSSLAARAIRASYAHASGNQRSKSFAAYGGTSFQNDSKSGLWGVVARKAKSILEEELELPNTIKSRTSNFSIGNPTQEGRTFLETKSNVDIIPESHKLENMRKGDNNSESLQRIASDANSTWQQHILQPNNVYESQLKASRDLAVATAAKAKLLLRELKTVKADLAFAKQRCEQLEEENKILRSESREKGDHSADDDLIRLQLETLLAEKGRLAKENSTYASENRFLMEIVEYHQLTMQDIVHLDEGMEQVTEVNPRLSSSSSSSIRLPTNAMDETTPIPSGQSNEDQKDAIDTQEVTSTSATLVPGREKEEDTKEPLVSSP